MTLRKAEGSSQDYIRFCENFARRNYETRKIAHHSHVGRTGSRAMMDKEIALYEVKTVPKQICHD